MMLLTFDYLTESALEVKSKCHFNKNKEVGIKKIKVGDKILVEAVV